MKLEIEPSQDSHIQSEVWFPTTTWNKRLWSAGNGGLAGSVDTLSLTVALSRDYAASATDTGHTGSDKDGSWALGHPEKLSDFGFRAIHETTVDAKVLLSAYFGHPPSYSYFVSGSNGGREGLMEAERFPDDYDGIQAGAPALEGTNIIPVTAWMQQQLLRTPASWIPASKLPAITAAVIKECDAKDGLVDGQIDDPRECHFQPESLLCKGEETKSCLTQAQVLALRAIYEGPPQSTNSTHCHSPYRGYAPGGEQGWNKWIVDKGPRKSTAYLYSLEFYRYLIYQEPRWTLDNFDLAHDAPETVKRLGPSYDACDADLSRFAQRGGKLILYHGWNDFALPPEMTIDYYQRIETLLGADRTHSFVQLYMAPGMEHAFAGPGPNAFGQAIAPPASADPSDNISTAMEEWVEHGVVPGAIIAGKYSSDIKPLIDPEGMKAIRTRPLCPFPQVARWNGSGSIDDATNFSCVAQK